MGKIDLNLSILNYQSEQTFSLLCSSKYSLSLKRFVFFFNALVILHFLSGNVINAQYYNQTPEFLKANSHWAFATNTGLNFNSGIAVPFLSASTGNEGHATISDRNTGNLLFYTNGGSVWNANHQLMPNGTGLMGNPYSNAYTTLQGSLIVPFINDSNKYYLFSLAGQGGVHSDTNGKSGSLFYSILDMTLDNGNGDVDANNKNIVLDTFPLGESLIAIPGCNNDIWVVTHSHVYKAYHITENGLNTNPVLSASNINSFISSLTVSSDRKKIVITNLSNASSHSPVELSDFDPASGTVSNSILVIPDTGGYTMAAAFSTDNSKLYFTNISSNSIFNLSGNLVQYNISISDSARIASTKQVISRALPFGCLKLYNDTIYVTSLTNTTAIHRINQPNNPGTACNFQLGAIMIPGNRGTSLSNHVVFAIATDTIATFLDSIICTGWEEGILLAAKDISFTTYNWSTGDTTASIQINGRGTYRVSYTECNRYYVDSFVIKGSNLFTAITINGFELGTTGGPFASYQWYLNGEPISGATYPTHTVTENGHYTVEITDSYGCVFRSEVYEVTNVNIKDLQQLSGTISIYPNPATNKINVDAPIPVQVVLTGIDGKELLQGNNASPVNIGSLAQGFYFLTVTDIEGRVLKIEKIIKQ